MTGPLVVVGCGATKHDAPTRAGSMYLGGYHRACRRVATRLTTPDRTLILSAQHGLLGLDDHIAPYDLRMGDRGAVTAALVEKQAAGRGLLDQAPVVVLAGRRYADVVTAVWPTAHAPLAGTGGMGHQLAALARFAATPSLALPYTPPRPGPALLQPGLTVEATSPHIPKNGGRYGGRLVSHTSDNAVVDCWDGVQRRFPLRHLRLNPARILLDAWNHYGYINPETSRPTTAEWDWLDWTLDKHVKSGGT